MAPLIVTGIPVRIVRWIRNRHKNQVVRSLPAPCLTSRHCGACGFTHCLENLSPDLHILNAKLIVSESAPIVQNLHVNLAADLAIIVAFRQVVVAHLFAPLVAAHYWGGAEGGGSRPIVLIRSTIVCPLSVSTCAIKTVSNDRMPVSTAVT